MQYDVIVIAHDGVCGDNGATFEDRANIYAEMAAVLEAKGIDSKWFAVASDLMRYFADSPTDALATFELWNPEISIVLGAFGNFSQGLSLYLLQANAETFDLLSSGKMGLTGRELDYFLVHKEQEHVQTFINTRYADDQQIRPDFMAWGAEVLAAFDPKYSEALDYVEDNSPDHEYNYWDKEDRILLGIKLVDMKWDEK